MKKRSTKIFALVLILCIICALTACSMPLSGTYRAVDGLIDQKVTFLEDNRIELEAFGVEIEGDYFIEDGQITVVYNILGLRTELVKSFERDGGSIFIDGVEFMKQK